MTDTKAGNKKADVRAHRLTADEVAQNFGDMHPPLTHSEALIEADRCYFCYDAPCTNACPTDIDIPGFIQGIRSHNLKGAAHTILRENIMGGMCARVCPTEVLCEEACVRNTHERQPVRIGLLQRHATDPVFEENTPLFERAPDTGKNVAVVGGGPAGLSCAHRLATLGHRVTVFNQSDKLGGLNEYGIAAYKTVNDFAQREVDYILNIGGIDVKTGVVFGKDIALEQLRKDYDAVFLGFGLAGVNELGLDNERVEGVEDAVKYIANLRQTEDKGELPVGRRVVVIGGGMTAIDIAVQSKRLGAEDVTLVYRGGPERMKASEYERDFAQTNGVKIKTRLQPKRLLADGRLTGVEFEYTEEKDDRPTGTGETCTVEADIVFKAIGQRVLWDELGATADLLDTEAGRIVVSANRKTSLPDVWAGGDCVVDGENLTVSAVQDGKLAALDIDAYLKG